MRKNLLMVSILCLAYNHKQYIRDTIEGFLMQKTDFNFEIIIHDDASTDGTDSILREYERKYPKLIHIIYETENQYSKFKYPTRFFVEMMRKEIKGDYIAACEGDDYWTDANKLQLQIDYMESHPDCIMTGHDAWRLNCRTGNREKIKSYPKEMDISADKLIRGAGNITTASLVYRKEVLDRDDFFLDVVVGDYPLKLYCLAKGKIHYFDRTMSVYRYLSGDEAWSSQQINDRKKYLIRYTNIFAFLGKYNIYTNRMYFVIIKEFIREQINILVREFSGLSEDEFQDLCQSCDECGDYEAHTYYMEMFRLFKQYKDETYLDDKVNEFIKTNKYRLIYGAGMYGKLVAKQLQNNNVEFEGFIVSDNQEIEETCEGKKVWKLRELPYKESDIGVVIAVRPEFKEEIVEALRKNKIDNYIYSFEINFDELIV